MMPTTINLQEYFDFDKPNAIRVKGHRLGIEHILRLYKDGYTAQEITEEFPGLALEVVYAGIAHYLTSKPEMDAYLIRIHEQNEDDYQAWTKNPSLLIQRLRSEREQSKIV